MKLSLFSDTNENDRKLVNESENNILRLANEKQNNILRRCDGCKIINLESYHISKLSKCPHYFCLICSLNITKKYFYQIGLGFCPLCLNLLTTSDFQLSRIDSIIQKKLNYPPRIKYFQVTKNLLEKKSNRTDFSPILINSSLELTNYDKDQHISLASNPNPDNQDQVISHKL